MRRDSLKKRAIVGVFILLSLFACESKPESEKITSESEQYPEVLAPVDKIESDKEQQIVEVTLINQSLTELGIELEEEQIGVVIHNPTPQQFKAVELIEYTVEPIEEGFLFIPKLIGNQIKLYEVSWEGDELVAGELLFEQNNLADRQAFYLQCPVPEGIPMLKVVIEDEEQRVDYVITYDGSGMRKQVEVLSGELD